jgi:hypothetical protein
MIVTLLLALAVEAAAPSAAAPTAAPPATSAPATAPAQPNAGSELVCKFETVTGSRFPKKVCRNKADAEQQRLQDHQQIRESQRATGGTHY